MSNYVNIFIPIKAVYKYVHSLHHRNTDIEPFAGLSMHPVEHLYYYRLVNFVDLLNTHSESSFFLYIYCSYYCLVVLDLPCLLFLLFSCVGPSLVLFASPFAFLWNGIHLMISPGNIFIIQSDQ